MPYCDIINPAYEGRGDIMRNKRHLILENHTKLFGNFFTRLFETRSKLLLAVTNVLLIAAAVIFTVVYSEYNESEKLKVRLDSFASATESMKSVSKSYLDSERTYAFNWASYINRNDMTLEEALDFLKTINTQSDRYAHIVDMDTLEAYSTYENNGSNEVHAYTYMAANDIATNKIFLNNMRKMFSEDESAVNVIGKYRDDSSQTNVISVGTKITLKTGSGSRDYLLLRVIPIESMRKIWVFPMDFSDAEVSLITNSGAYVIQSPSMRSENFIEYIRGYNYADDYNGIDDFVKRLSETDSGMLRYKDFRGDECYWYYSSFGDDSGLDILGYIKASSLDDTRSNWAIVCVICTILLILLLIDGHHIMHINRNLRESVQLAEQASYAKTQFLSSMSHDIRTPMNAVIGMTELAKRNADNAEYVRECLDKISAAGNHLITLVNDILDISKVESGKMRLDPTAFSIGDFINGIVDIIRPQISQKEQELCGHYSDLPVEYIVADELRLNQIYLNILTNAVKYTGNGGRITLDLAEQVLPENKVRLIFSVSDNGIGMSEEFQQNMYNSFERATNTRINKVQGSGLGLAIVKQMTELMGGTVECRSIVGEGTTFTVRIDVPIADKADEELVNSEMSADKNSFKGMRVLVAEDNEINWEIAETMLAEFGVESDRVCDGKACVEAINSAPAGRYDMIFMDVQMPVMDGREATRIIRQSTDEYIRSIPIVAMTADAFAEDIRSCRDSGMDGHIAKPIEIKKLQAYLQKFRKGE